MHKSRGEKLRFGLVGNTEKKKIWVDYEHLSAGLPFRGP